VLGEGSDHGRRGGMAVAFWIESHQIGVARVVEEVTTTHAVGVTGLLQARADGVLQQIGTLFLGRVERTPLGRGREGEGGGREREDERERGGGGERGREGEGGGGGERGGEGGGGGVRGGEGERG
jgi:hypothetical protein